MLQTYPYKIKLPKEKSLLIEEVIKWCDDIIGPENSDWYWSYTTQHAFDYEINFHFAKEGDLGFFILKWI